MRVTRMVAQIVENSPRQYEIAVVQLGVENSTVQYGPPPTSEPDASRIAVKNPDGSVSLVVAPISPVSAALLAQAKLHIQSGQLLRAVNLLDESIAKSPFAPILQLARAEALVTLDPKRAEDGYRKLLALDPTLATAHLGLSKVLLARQDDAGARDALAHAIALHPVSAQALELAQTLRVRPESRAEPFAIFLDVDPRGAIRLASRGTSSARMYAGCRAVMRFEPELRGYLFAIPESEPYFLSLAEEILCYQSGIGAYLADRANARHEGKPVVRDDQAEALLGLAHTEGLSGYLTVEVLGRFRPEFARSAPSSVHRAAVAYVKDHWLGIPARDQQSGLRARVDPELARPHRIGNLSP